MSVLASQITGNFVNSLLMVITKKVSNLGITAPNDRNPPESECECI